MPAITMWRALLAVLALGVLVGWIAIWTTFATDAPVRTVALSTPGAAGGAVAVDERAGRAVVAGMGSSVTILDTHSGEVVRTVSLKNPLCGAAAISTGAGHTFVLNQGASYGVPGATASMLDTRTGALVHTATVPLDPIAAAVDERSGHVFVASIGATRPNAMPVGPGTVTILDARSGRVLRRVPAGLSPWAIAVDGKREHVFVANLNSTTVTMLDARSGTVLHTARMRRQPTALAVDEGTGHVFVAQEQGDTVTMLDARNGAVVRAIGVPFPLALAVDAAAGHVVVTGIGRGGAGQVSLLDTASGAVLRTTEVGGDPNAVAVDGRTGRAMVTGAGSRWSVLLHHVGHGQLSWLGEWTQEYVSVVDTRSGDLLHTVHVAAARVAVDTRSGHAFVTTPANNTVSMLDATG